MFKELNLFYKYVLKNEDRDELDGFVLLLENTKVLLATSNGFIRGQNLLHVLRKM